RPVPADDPQHLAALNLEGNVVQRPEFLDLVPLDDLPSARTLRRGAGHASRLPSDGFAERLLSSTAAHLVADQITLAEVLDLNDDVVWHAEASGAASRETLKRAGEAPRNLPDLASCKPQQQHHHRDADAHSTPLDAAAED